MADVTRRGPKKGKRLTAEIQSEMLIEAINSKKTILDVIEQYRKNGYNIKDEVEADLKSIGPTEMSFMLANKQILEAVKEDAVKSIISDINKKGKKYLS